MVEMWIFNKVAVSSAIDKRALHTTQHGTWGKESRSSRSNLPPSSPRHARQILACNYSSCNFEDHCSHICTDPVATVVQSTYSISPFTVHRDTPLPFLRPHNRVQGRPSSEPDRVGGDDQQAAAWWTTLRKFD
ncbi:hypothetical protein F2P81_016234 [Scophthalmus maximus]|uniref:Uncharacterized protein n=1 Tax=Scophthalmus maximus TaxID=52904 RepID=A0A6A4SGP7_SCOMX|nr:hypothetical protein F2P81_016234 [Scophthalmus maximus]